MMFNSHAGTAVLSGLALLLLAAGARPASALDAGDLGLGGAGWFQYGRIGHSSDTANMRVFSGRAMVTSGAQIVLRPRISGHLGIEAGIGAISGHYITGSKGENGGYAPMNVSPYVAQANFRYAWREEGEPGPALSLRGGLFDYDYAPEAQNLGLYLLRGPVRPGYVLSGFETKHVLPVANVLGAQVHLDWNGLSQDLLLSMDTEFFPYYDLSPAYIASYRLGPAFRLGAGVNLYHFIPIDAGLTSDTSMVFIDTVPAVDDTVRIGFAGTKVMANFSFDPKAFLDGPGPLGPEDLKLYGEAALIGLENGRAYREVYGDYLHRMPMMAGFNLPAFRMLDRLSLEVEWYGARFKDDLKGYNHTSGNTIKPFPPPDPDRNVVRDNWKWSLYGSRTLRKRIKASFQVANDHYRPGIFTGYGDNSPPGSQALTITPKDWYWMGKLAYLF